MKYAAFFRGINVGGKNKVKMAELQSLFEGCGFRAVKTYIQSGNVVFESVLDEPALSGIISAAFEERFGFPSQVVLRTDHEISEILENLPFTEKEIAQAEVAMPDVAHVYLFLSGKAVAPAVAERGVDGDVLIAGKREYYLICRKSIRDSKIAAALSKPEAGLTARNLNTLQKINQMFVSE